MRLSIRFRIALSAIAMALAFLALSTSTVAQTVPPVAADAGWAGFFALVRDSLSAALVAIATGAAVWVSTKVQAWTGLHVDAKSTMEALNWEGVIKSAADNAFAFATSRTGITPENIKSLGDKSAFLNVALNFANRYNPEILAFLDGNHDGVLDLLEAQLAKIAPNAPVTPTQAPPAPVPPMAPQGFLQTPSTPMPHRRQTPAEMAAKLAPKRTKSTVMQ
jgi:hypothetical protein